jgi:hypothetical protein
MKIINVIEITNGIFEDIKSWVIVKDKDESIMVSKAEKFFSDCIKENAPMETDEDIECHIENGYFDEGGYEIKLTWSTIIN